MKLSFYGAARTVTGSKHLLTLDNGLQILLDCGMFQGLGPRTAALNEELGFDATKVSFMLLSHAHIDHSGLIPLLVKRGFTGKIFCTEATRELAEILLYDSAEIQAHDADLANKISENSDAVSNQPLYTVDDVKECLSLFETVQYKQPFEPAPGVTVLFSNVGHLIGSASIHITIRDGNNSTTILYSGDVGRYRSMLLQSPDACPPADHIILESTYGNSLHQPNFSTIDPLEKWIKNTCLEKKGKLIIPAFSVGRTQEVLYALNQLELEHRLPELSYFVDTPLGAKATQVIKRHMHLFNDRLQNILSTDDDPFDFAGLKYIETPEDSKKLTEYNEPCVIISSSGTADAGRVKHHIFTTLHDRKNTILFVGYCQDQSLGGQLLAGNRMVELFGNTCSVEAEIGVMNSLSAHGDADDLLKFIDCQDADSVKEIFLVHGELQTQHAFAEKLKRKRFAKVTVPAHQQEISLV